MQAGSRNLGLQRDPVPVAAGELHHRLHAQLLECDRDCERRCMRVRRGVVGGVDGVDPVLVRREALAYGFEPAGVDGEELGRDDEASRRECVLKPRHATPSASAGRAS